MADVFISYAREDREHAQRVATGLSALGLDIFWDTDIPPGQTWADYIEGKLSASRAAIVLWSSNSTKSQSVREEARIARDRSRLIPAMLENVPLPFGFGEVQAADLSGWAGDYNDPNWLRFAQAVQNAVASAPAPGEPVRAVAPPPAAPPLSHARSNTFAPAAGAAAGQASPIDYIKKCLRLYADGKGRARRAEYWWWALFAFGVTFVASFLDTIMFGVNPQTMQPNMQALSTIAGLALLAPGVSVASRRFHDVGLSGWLVAGFFAAFFVAGALNQMGSPLAMVIMLVAGVGMLAIAVMPSKPGENQYGPNPKGE